MRRNRRPESALRDEYDSTVGRIDEFDRQIADLYRRRSEIYERFVRMKVIGYEDHPVVNELPQHIRQPAKQEAYRLKEVLEDIDDRLDDMEDIRESLFLTLGYGNDNPIDSDDDDQLFDPLDDDE